MLNFVRARNVDYVPSKLADPDIYKTLPQGAWVLPASISTAGEVVYAVPATIDPVADKAAVRNARISFSEPGKLDTKIVGMITSVAGVLTLRTDQFIAADAASMDIGTELTLKVDSTDNMVKLGVLASATDEVVAIVEVPPTAHPESELIFHCTLY